MAVLEEKKVGTFRRILAAPMPRAVFLLGKLLPNLIMNVIQIVLMFAVGVFVMPALGTPRLELGAHPGALRGHFTGRVAEPRPGWGLLIAALSPDHRAGRRAVEPARRDHGSHRWRHGSAFCDARFLQTAGLITPHAWALDAYQDVLVRGYGLLHVLPEVAALLGFSVVFFGIALWRFRWD